MVHEAEKRIAVRKYKEGAEVLYELIEELNNGAQVSEHIQLQHEYLADIVVQAHNDGWGYEFLGRVLVLTDGI